MSSARAPYQALISQGPYQINQGPSKKGKVTPIQKDTQRTFFFHFWKPLKFILGLPKRKFYATEGPQPLAADRALFLNPPLVKKGVVFFIVSSDNGLNAPCMCRSTTLIVLDFRFILNSK